MMIRRDFLSLLGAPLWAAPPQSAWILPHEHVVVDFRAPGQQAPYDTDAVFRLAKPHLDEVVRLGCKRFLDCTPNYIGRNPKLLRRLSDACNIDIWTNTGWYAARDHKYLPPEARTETAAQIASRWIGEHKSGVDGLTPRFVKIGVNRAPLHAIDRKIVEAAAICSRETGLTVASHTGGAGPAAIEQLEIFTAAKASLTRFVWVHADSEKDHSFHEKAARAGAWVEFDHVSEKNLAFHLECVRFMAGKGLLNRTLISQDAGYYRPGEPGGGPFRPYAFLFTGFVPKLDPRWVPDLIARNPVTAFGGKPV